MTEPVRALHVNDCAFTAKHLVAEAHRRGLPWSYLPAGRDRTQLGRRRWRRGSGRSSVRPG